MYIMDIDTTAYFCNIPSNNSIHIQIQMAHISNKRSLAALVVAVTLSKKTTGVLR